MSKYVKDLVAKELSSRLEGVDEALLVNVIGIGSNETVALRRELREKGISLLVVKNSMAARATEGTALAPAFEGITGTSALMWGGEDLISLAKEAVRLTGEKDYEPFAPIGGIMEGESLSAEKVKEISKWPNREGQLSILVGQILAPGANLLSQLEAPGGKLASQIEKKSKEGDE